MMIPCGHCDGHRDAITGSCLADCEATPTAEPAAVSEEATYKRTPDVPAEVDSDEYWREVDRKHALHRRIGGKVP